jgi:hypothetical protein
MMALSKGNRTDLPTFQPFMRKSPLICLLLCPILSVIGCQCPLIKKNPPDYNRYVWLPRFEQLLPKEICIPKGYYITHIYDGTDLDGDGLEDFIFEWNRKSLKSGDTIFISAYLQKTDSSFVFLKTFSNLKPIYFDSYSDFQSKDERLNQLHRIYGGYPLQELRFENQQIIIRFNDNSSGRYAGVLLTYLFDPGKGDWFLSQQQRWREDEEIEIVETIIPEPGLSIELFNYLDYIEY